MSRFLRQSHPHLVLFSPLRRQQGKDGHYDKDHDNAQLPIRILREAFQQRRLIIAHQLIVYGVSDLDIVPGLVHPTAIVGYIPDRVLVPDVHIPIVHHLLIAVKHNHRDGLIALDHTQHQCQVSHLVSLLQRLHSPSPNLHLVSFLIREVRHQKMRHQQRGNGYDDCHNHQDNFHLSYSVCPLHNAAKIHIFPETTKHIKLFLYSGSFGRRQKREKP